MTYTYLTRYLHSCSRKRWPHTWTKVEPKTIFYWGSTLRCWYTTVVVQVLRLRAIDSVRKPYRNWKISCCNMKIIYNDHQWNKSKKWIMAHTAACSARPRAVAQVSKQAGDQSRKQRPMTKTIYMGLCRAANRRVELTPKMYVLCTTTLCKAKRTI